MNCLFLPGDFKDFLAIRRAISLNETFVLGLETLGTFNKYILTNRIGTLAV